MAYTHSENAVRSTGMQSFTNNACFSLLWIANSYV